MSRARAQHPSAPRCGALWLGATVSAAALLTWVVPHAVGAWPTGGAVPFEVLLVVSCEIVAATGVGWLWLLVTLVVRDALHGTRSAAPVPVVVRRLVLAGCGLSLAGGLAAPAHAQQPDPDRPVGAVLAGLAVPDRMSTTAWLGALREELRREPARRVPSRSSADPPRQVVVGPGDTLWSLARSTLPPTADADTVDRRWRDIYRANRRLVGPDPDLILPGQRLVLPQDRPHDREE